MYRIFRTDWYETKFKRLSKPEQDRVVKFEQELKLQPYDGKPLGYKFFREKKFNGKRLIFLVYESHEVVFLITIADKKVQQQEIEVIKANLDVYNDMVENTLKNIKSP
ncbi:MAG: hypothetical protein Q7J54_00790 [Candidatus Woesearchaeota archaeon]|nr:hypothetical protein [Candidatus Woesearchaeota archaeon]